MSSDIYLPVRLYHPQWCQQPTMISTIGIEGNIFIIVDIYITSATSVTLSLWIISIRSRHPEPRKYICKRAFIDYLCVHNSAHTISNFYLFVFAFTTLHAPYMFSIRVSDSFAWSKLVFMPVIFPRNARWKTIPCTWKRLMGWVLRLQHFPAMLFISVTDLTRRIYECKKLLYV